MITTNIFNWPLRRRPCSGRMFSLTSSRHYSVSSSIATRTNQYVANSYQEQMSSNELFAHTSGRWLWNDDIHQRLRFKPFNVNLLEDAVCRSMNAQRCLSWKKIGEGSFNKVFLLEFNNDRKAALRIPNPLVPSQELSIASEVATMEYVRERFASDEMVPKPPKVFAWDASPSNATGTAYILLEYLEGVPLTSRWYDICGEPVVSALQSLLGLERSLLAEPFSQHGSIYFADTNEGIKSRPLYRSEEHESRYPTLAEKYRIGPMVTREWWRDCYGAVQANRGPWSDMPTMIRSAAELQLQVLADGVGLKNPYVRTTSTDVPELRRLLKICISIADVVTPFASIHSQPSFNHPDLTLDNLLIRPDGDDLTIQGLIDWQGACIAPYCTVNGLPTAVVYDGGLINNPGEFGKDPPFPEGFDSLPRDEQEVIRVHHRLAVRQQVYSELVVQLQPSRYKTWRLPHRESLSNLVGLTLRSVSDGPQALREILLEVKEQWDEIIALSRNGADIPCPIDFSSEEIETIQHAKENRSSYDHNKRMVCGDIGCGPDGWVHLADFEEAKKKLQKWERDWNNEDMGGPFPFYDGAWWYNLT